MCMLNGFAWHFCAVFQQRQTWFFKENAHLLMTSVAGSSCSSLGQTETHLFCPARVMNNDKISQLGTESLNAISKPSESQNTKFLPIK